MFQRFVDPIYVTSRGSRSQQWRPHQTQHVVELGPPWDCGLANTQLAYPVVNGGSDKRSVWGTHIPYIPPISWGAKEVRTEFLNHLIVVNHRITQTYKGK